jgi:xanthine/uracil permease
MLEPEKGSPADKFSKKVLWIAILVVVITALIATLASKLAAVIVVVLGLAFVGAMIYDLVTGTRS